MTEKIVNWLEGYLSSLKLYSHKMAVRYKEENNNQPGSHCFNQVITESIMGKKTYWHSAPLDQSP